MDTEFSVMFELVFYAAKIIPFRTMQKEGRP